MCGWLVDEVVEKLRIKKNFNRREAHEKGRLVFSQKAVVGLFQPLNKKIFTFRQLSIVGSTTLLLLQQICIDENAFQLLYYCPASLFLLITNVTALRTSSGLRDTFSTCVDF